MNIKNIIKLYPIDLYCSEDECIYEAKDGIIIVEYEDNSRRILDIINRVDITNYEKYEPMINKESDFEYIFKGDVDFYE